MSWTEHTELKYHHKGYSGRGIGVRNYTYCFRGPRFLDRFARFKTNISRQFDTVETSVNGDSNGHRAVLKNPDFSINGINVMEWAREVVQSGRARFEFVVTYQLMSGEDSILIMEASFSDPKIAVLFKLTFG